MNATDASAMASSPMSYPQPSMPPDLVIVVTSITIFQFLELVHRRAIGPRFRAYNTLPFRDRFDWDRRALNISFQLVQVLFNSYLLLLDPQVTSDYLYGYSTVAHTGFLVIIAFYVYDSTGMVMHPAPQSTTPMWLAHHFIAVGLLLFDVSYQQSSAFPAAAFLISAAGHIPNELRWLLTASSANHLQLLNVSNVLCATIVFLTCGLPPPFLLLRCAQQLNISIFELVTKRMRSYCTFFFSLIYFPHLILIAHQFKRAYTNWNKPPQVFRPTKVD